MAVPAGMVPLVTTMQLPRLTLVISPTAAHFEVAEAHLHVEFVSRYVSQPCQEPDDPLMLRFRDSRSNACWI